MLIFNLITCHVFLQLNINVGNNDIRFKNMQKKRVKPQKYMPHFAKWNPDLHHLKKLFTHSDPH